MSDKFRYRALKLIPLFIKVINILTKHIHIKTKQARTTPAHTHGAPCTHAHYNCSVHFTCNTNTPRMHYPDRTLTNTCIYTYTHCATTHGYNTHVTCTHNTPIYTCTHCAFTQNTPIYAYTHCATTHGYNTHHDMVSPACTMIPTRNLQSACNHLFCLFRS